MIKINRFVRSRSKLRVVVHNFQEHLELLTQLKTKYHEKYGSVVSFLADGTNYSFYESNHFEMKSICNFTIGNTDFGKFCNQWFPSPHSRRTEFIPEDIKFEPQFLGGKNGPDSNQFNSGFKIYQKQGWTVEEYIEKMVEMYVIVADKAMLNMLRYFKDHFKIDLFVHNTMSAASNDIMFQLVDQKCPPIETTNEKFYGDQFRRFAFGGINALMMRHITTSDNPDYPKEARYTKDGTKISKIISYDFNAMYPSTYSSDFPCGFPVYFERKEDKFLPRFGTSTDRFSKISLEYLEWAEQELVAKHGNKISIQTALNGGEKKVGPYFVDGFVRIGSENHYYEFNGCVFHQCECYWLKY